MRIAVVGCSHGSLDDLYATVERCDRQAKERKEPGIDLLICCGDFQAMRCPSDLHAMACPPKYRALGHFAQYYSERKLAPFLTIVIGGNHESSGYMWECFHGAWLAPKIYFLGFAGCVLVDNWLRIAGSSGIWKAPDFRRGHFETVPFDESTIRSVYHVREYDVARLSQLGENGPAIDIFLSHDWPLGIEQHGDVKSLIREKPFFKNEIASNTLGSPPLHHLLKVLRPSFWFSAHLHVKFAALVHHSGSPTLVNAKTSANPGEQGLPLLGSDNPDEIMLEDEDENANNPDEIAIEDTDEHDRSNIDGAAREGDAPWSRTFDLAAEFSRSTKFLALSKPGTRSGFLQVLDFPRPLGSSSAESGAADQTGTNEESDTRLSECSETSRTTLYFDPDWLAIVRAFNSSLSLERNPASLPDPSQIAGLIKESRDWINDNIVGGGNVKIEDVLHFSRTAPGQGEPNWDNPTPIWYTNPQTEAFCAFLGITNNINPVPEGYEESRRAAAAAALRTAKEEALKNLELVSDSVDEEPTQIPTLV